MLGGIQPNIGPVGQNQGSNEAAKELQTISREIGELKSDLTNLSNELIGGQSTAGTKQTSQSDQQGNQVGRQQQKSETSRADVVPNEAIAIAADEEDKKLKKKRKTMDLDQKLAMLMELEEAMDGAVLDNPEHKEIVEQFFTNMNQIKNLRGRLRGLEEKEERLKETLKLMQEQESLQESSSQAQPTSNASQDAIIKEPNTSVDNESSASFQRPSNLPPHIQITPLDQNSSSNNEPS